MRAATMPKFMDVASRVNDRLHNDKEPG